MSLQVEKLIDPKLADAAYTEVRKSIKQSEDLRKEVTNTVKNDIDGIQVLLLLPWGIDFNATEEI